MPIVADNIKGDQTIYDFCITKYGSLDFISDLIFDNDIKFDDILDIGTELKTDSTFGDKTVKNQFKELDRDSLSFIKGEEIPVISDALLFGGSEETLLFGGAEEYIKY